MHGSEVSAHLRTQISVCNYMGYACRILVYASFHYEIIGFGAISAAKFIVMQRSALHSQHMTFCPEQAYCISGSSALSQIARASQNGSRKGHRGGHGTPCPPSQCYACEVRLEVLHCLHLLRHLVILVLPLQVLILFPPDEVAKFS